MIVEKYRKIILDAIPEGTVIPRHDESGHKYYIPSIDKTLRSVTEKLAIIKDPSLMNWKMNKALDYISRNWRNINEQTIMDIIDAAAKAPVEEFEDAGDVGRDIHSYREAYFKEWILTGNRPVNALDFIPKDERDIRVVSAIRALEKFCIKENYIPLATELYVYSEKYNIAGTLDDIGIMLKISRKPNIENCTEKHLSHYPKLGHFSCSKCGIMYKVQLVLSDLKTSNQIKTSFAYQIALYYGMFKELTGLTPKRNFVLKLSKIDGTYLIQDIFQINKILSYAKAVLKVNEGENFVKKIFERNTLIL